MRAIKYQMDSTTDMTLRISQIVDGKIIFFSVFTAIYFVGGFLFVFLSGFSLFRFFLFFVILIALIIGGIGLPVMKNYKNQRKTVPVKSGYGVSQKKSTKFVMVCASCGEEVTPDDIYCSECGVTIN